MPPDDRFVCRFAAEPPQDPLPYGRWAETLQAEFLAACLKIDADGEDLGEAGELSFYPDRTWSGRTYVPVTTAPSPTSGRPQTSVIAATVPRSPRQPPTTSSLRSIRQSGLSSAVTSVKSTRP